MPFFVDSQRLLLVHRSPGEPAPAACEVVDGDTAARCGAALHADRQLTPSQARALLDGDVAGFFALLDSDEQERLKLSGGSQLTTDLSPALPPIGRWEYRVVPMTELLGFATARGTASRMEEALNTLAADGWELVTSSERESRWLGGESVLLTLRRFVVTEDSFSARVRVEERLRRKVLNELDSWSQDE